MSASTSDALSTRLRSILRSALVPLLMVLVAAVPGSLLQAQPVSLEARGALTNGLGDLGDVSSSDAGLGADLFVTLSPNLSVYGGYGLDMFDCTDCVDDDATYDSSGFEAGVKLLARRTGGVLPWLRGGLVLHELSLDNQGLEITTDRGLGFQVGAGVDIPLGEVLSFSPAVRYQRYDADFAAGLDDVQVQNAISYVTADFGLHVHLAALRN